MSHAEGNECLGGSELPFFQIGELPDTNLGFASGAERGLMSAILFDGVQSFISYACAESEGQRKRYREAYIWVTTRGTEYVFSFDNVCDGLGIDPDFMRCGLVNAISSESQQWKKMRRNF